MTIITALPEVSNEDFNQVLDDIRARYPRRKFDLHFEDPQLESTFVDYYAVRMIDKNKFVALMTGTVLGNYLVLTLGNHARAQDYTSSLVAYTFASVTAITEAYLLEGKARDVFLMERIVADAQAVNPDSVAKSGDLVESIRRARLRRAGISEIDDAAEVRPWQDGPRTRDMAEYSCDQQESGISGALDRKSLLVLQPLAEDEDAEVGLETKDDPPARLAPAGKKSRRHRSIAGLRGLGRRWWKNVYLAWPDEYHEENYLRWQNRSFGSVYGMAILLQFCKPTIRGRQSTYLCEKPGPDHLRHIYIYFFTPTLAVAIVVATFPIIGVHPTITHRCATLAFALLFSGYTWLTIEASQVSASFEGMSYSDSSYEMFDAYSINVLIAAGGCSALPSHWYQA
ncbi:hypothetical protein HDU88_002308 [Geranomyces variabilis]|nr:hypothetical protein HDU88_002308 [Geranomyces variabilis]